MNYNVILLIKSTFFRSQIFLKGAIFLNQKYITTYRNNNVEVISVHTFLNNIAV